MFLFFADISIENCLLKMLFNTGDQPVFLSLFYKVYSIHLCKIFEYHFFFAHLIWNSRFSCLTIMLVPAKNFMKTFAMKYLGNGKYSNWAVRNAFITFFCLVTFMEQFLQKRWVFDLIFYWVWLCDFQIGVSRPKLYLVNHSCFQMWWHYY